MAGSIFGEFSKDGYGFWGYVETEKRMMLFVSPEEYREYISIPRITRKEPYWKQQGSSYFRNNYTSYNEEVKSNETQRT